MTRFSILAMPRTGSNLLCTLLNNHPRILCHHELFNPRGIFVALDQRRGNLDLGSIDQRDQDPLAFLERVWQQGTGRQCVGFKMTHGQSKDVLEHVLHSTRIKKILLRRANRLKTFVSTLIAEQTDHWEAYSTNEIVSEPPRVNIHLDELLAFTERSDRFHAMIKETLDHCEQEYLEVTYEQLLSPQEQRRLLHFLGVEAVDLDPASLKQNSRDLRDLVLNFSDLDKQLAGSPYHDELHDLDH